MPTTSLACLTSMLQLSSRWRKTSFSLTSGSFSRLKRFDTCCGFFTCILTLLRMKRYLFIRYSFLRGFARYYIPYIGEESLQNLRAILKDRILSYIEPDVQIQAVPSKDYFAYHHRRQGEVDIYFIANLSDQTQEAQIRLRSWGYAELWDPSTGRTEPLVVSKQSNGILFDHIFAPHESLFVVVDTSKSCQTLTTPQKKLCEILHSGFSLRPTKKA